MAGHRLFVFGTNGAGIHLALRIQETEAPIVWIEWPYGASDSGQILSNDFESFVRLIGG